MSLISDTDDAHLRYKNIAEYQRLGNRLKLETGRELSQLKKKNLYKKAVGAGIDTWHHFLKLPEIDITQHEAKKLIDIHEFFFNKSELSMEELSLCKIDNLSYIIKEEIEPTDDILELAETLSHQEFKEAVTDMKKGEDRQYDYLVMQRVKETNNLRRVKGISTEDVLNAFKINESIPKKIRDNDER